MSAPKLDDATPFPWSEIRRPARAKVVASSRAPEVVPTDLDRMQRVAEALYGTCRACGCLLDIDGTCPEASSHEKHVCPDCGAESAERLSVAHPCLFADEHGKAAE